MADNVVTNPGAGGETFATDEIGGVHFPISKIAYGGPDAATQVSAAAPLPVTITQLLAAIFATGGSATLGDTGIPALFKRRDADSSVVADGQYMSGNCDEEGRLKVASKPASYVATTGNITSAASTVFIDCSRFSNLMIHCAGTFSSVNCAFEGSLNSTDGSNGNWFGVQAIRSNANTIETTTGSLSAAPAYAWELSVNAMKYFRLRATAWTSGTQVWTLIPGTYATEPIPASQITGTQAVSFTQPALVAGAARIGFAAGAGIWYDDSSTVLAGAATFTGTSRDLTVTATATAFANAATYAKELRVSAESDQTGTLWLEVSRDNTNWRRIKSVATAAIAGGGQYAEIIHRPSWRYARVGFTNGATLQTRFSIGSIAIAL